MSDSILFLGTSFLGAIKQAYESLFPTRGVASFVGFNAPELVANLKSGWNVSDGHLQFASGLSCFVSGLEQHTDQRTDRVSGSKTFPGSSKISGLGINLRRYRSIVLVDMFHRQRPPFIVDERLFPSVAQHPVSAALLAELQVNGFNGWISLSQHQQYGTVPFVNAKRLLTAIKEASGSASVFLLSAPRPPAGNVDIHAKYGDVASARRCLDYLERFYANELARHDIEYLAQPVDVLDDDGCLTSAHYSRGAHSTMVGCLDEHMNRQYGEVILAKYSDRIMGRI